MKKLKVIILEGEKVSLELCKEIRNYTEAKIYNIYGPTETAVWSTILEKLKIQYKDYSGWMRKNPEEMVLIGSNY